MDSSFAKSSYLLKFGFQRFFGKNAVSAILFWFCCAAFLLFCNLQTCFLKPSSLTQILSLFIPVGAFLIIQFRSFGLVLNYVALIILFFMFNSTLSDADKLWRLGLVSVTALNFFIILMIREEISSLSEQFQLQFKNLKQDLENKESALFITQRNYEVERQELEQEIQELKEEAEQRKIDKQLLERKLELIESEIHFLTNQKDKFIQDTFDAKKRANEACAVSESLKKECEEALLAKQLLTDKYADTSDSLNREKENRTKLEHDVQSLRDNVQTIKAELSQTQKRLQESEIAKHSLEKEIKEKERQVFALNENLNSYKNELSLAQHASFEKEKLSKEIQEKVSLLADAKEHAEKLQDKMLILQSQFNQRSENTVTLEQKQEFDYLERQHKQLRKQFEEKSLVLNETRKELFQYQTKLMAQEKEREEELLIHENPHPFEEEVSQLVKQIEELENEIVSLEMLVSSIVLD